MNVGRVWDEVQWEKEKGEGSLTRVQMGEATLAAGEDTRSENPGPRKDADIPHAIIAVERNTVRRVRNMTAGSRKEKGSTMM